MINDYEALANGGRTSRVFANMMLMKRGVPPIFFSGDYKKEYKIALSEADLTGNYDHLNECFYKSIFKTFAKLTDYNL